MIVLLISSLYFFLPAYIANMCPIFAMALRLPLAKPINEKLFGAHKTWRGFYAGFAGALLVLSLQKYWQQQDVLSDYTLLDYSQINLFLYAFLFGIGALTGDLAKSFFKRRANKKSGAPWFPFDQLDFVAGALILTYPFYQLPLANIGVLLVATPLLHFLTNCAGYALGLKKVWW